MAVDIAAVVFTEKNSSWPMVAPIGHDLAGFLDGVLDPKQCPSLEPAEIPLLSPS